MSVDTSAELRHKILATSRQVMINAVDVADEVAVDTST